MGTHGCNNSRKLQAIAIAIGCFLCSVCVRMFVCVFAFASVCASELTCLFALVSACGCEFVCVCVFVCVCACEFLCVFVFVCVFENLSKRFIRLAPD